MTLVDRAGAPGDTRQRPRGWRRMWDAPFGLHLAALALVLLALVPVVGTSASFSADEGAAIVQARSLVAGDGWIVEHPVPQVDPTGDNYPLENSDRGPAGVAPYVKHPLYPVLLAGAAKAGGAKAGGAKAGGAAGMMLLSVAGTLAAAGLAAALARRIDVSLARPTLWVVGLASPLLFDGYLVMAHTLAAAAAVGAVLLAVKAIEDRNAWAAVAVAPCAAAGVMLRTEAVFLAVGLAVVAVAVSRRHGLAVAVAAAGGAWVGRAVEHTWTERILDGQVLTTTGAVPGAAGLEGRVRGFVLTWLTAGYDGLNLAGAALLVTLASVVLAALMVRRARPGDTRAIVALSVTAAAAAVVALVAGPGNVVPGLLVAFPLMAAGLVLVDRKTLATAAAKVAAGTFGLFALGVVATQYARGGSGEWGGRYFALGIPVIVPVLLAAIGLKARALAPEARRAVAASTAVVLVAMSAMAVGSLRTSHGHNAAMNGAIRHAIGSLGGTPVVVAGNGTVARQGWPTFDDGRWVLSTGDVAGLADRLAAAGERAFVLVTREPVRVAGYDVVSSRQGGAAGRPWYVDVLRKQ